ncbi:VWA domain-containing protein [Saxibacter everestensis]|uniref:VWA domain-containing protein n=1 Tax=Saxibacter everestensis TaxID=2909229 RepID=A0ABY8QX74_9MICO|nr:VWA domain-containing protein [Brevibacteriaceae bacterium ZFBP1038]
MRTHAGSGPLARAASNPPEAVLLGFCRALTAAGLPVTADRTHVFVDAVARLGYGRREHVFWAGSATLCSGPEELARFGRTFDAWFTDSPETATTRRQDAVRVAEAGLDPGEGTGDGQAQVAMLASTDDVLGRRDVAELSAAERELVNRRFASLTVPLPTRRALRTISHRRGAIDPVRTMREQLRRAGEPGPLKYRRRQVKTRRIVLLIDVSGSMRNYADSLLRLAHQVVRAAGRDAEVFTIGTRLTRVTRELRTVDVDRALLLAGQAVPDWAGGTRLGEVLAAFVDRWGQRGMARGAVVVVISDGWERGDPRLLGEQLSRLSNLARRLIWSNPHRGKPGYVPVQAGIAEALPYLDSLVAGHSLAAFAELLELIGDA